MAKDLILGIIDNYSYLNVERFFLSLYRTSFKGHVCLFFGPYNAPGLADELRKLNVEIISYQLQFPFIDHTHPANFAVLPSPVHLYNFRHFLYYDYLLRHPGKFENVFLTDVRDVIFQRNPFDYLTADALYVAVETQTIAECSWTSNWITAGYPGNVLAAIRDNQVICAGTTMGPTAKVLHYLKAILTEVTTVPDAMNCVDQGILNVLLYTGALEPSVRMNNRDGVVATIGTANPTALKFDSYGHLLDKTNAPVAVIHQYDRHPSKIQLLDGFIYNWRSLFIRPVFTKSVLKRFFHRIPLMTLTVRSARKYLR